MSELPKQLDTQIQRGEITLHRPENNNLDLLTLTKSNSLKTTNDNLPSKIFRSTTLVLGGVAGGALERSAELLTEKKGTAALELGTAAAVGFGLKTMAEAGGRWGQAAKAGTILLGLGLVADVYNRGAYAVGAISDNWQSPENYARNKDIVGRSIGAALPDYSLMALGGYIGLNPRLARDKASAKLADLSTKAVELAPPGLRENRFLVNSIDAAQATMGHLRNSELLGRLKSEIGIFGNRIQVSAESMLARTKPQEPAPGVTGRAREVIADSKSPRLMDRLAAVDHSINGGKPGYFDGQSAGLFRTSESPAAALLRTAESPGLVSRIGQMEFKGLNLNSIKLIETNLRPTVLPISFINYNLDSKLPRHKS